MRRRKKPDLFRDAVGICGVFSYTLRDQGKLVASWNTRNMAVVEWRNYALSAAWKGGSQTSTWYLGLIAGAATVTVDDLDTMSSHAGWVEFQSYTGGVRKTWSSASSPTGGSLPSASAATFTFTASGSLRGAFVTSSNTIGGTSGVLAATALEDANRAISANQTLDVTYRSTLTPVS